MNETNVTLLLQTESPPPHLVKVLGGDVTVAVHRALHVDSAVEQNNAHRACATRAVTQEGVCRAGGVIDIIKRLVQ